MQRFSWAAVGKCPGEMNGSRSFLLQLMDRKERRHSSVPFRMTVHRTRKCIFLRRLKRWTRFECVLFIIDSVLHEFYSDSFFPSCLSATSIIQSSKCSALFNNLRKEEVCFVRLKHAGQQDSKVFGFIAGYS